MAAEPAGSKDQPQSNVKETVESILVAFILAFIFRAFVVEAFVIPTGSMAPTLYGAHMRLRCPDCGTVFDVGYSVGRTENGEEIDVPASAKRVMDLQCPNCGYTFPAGENQRVRFGDRILVLKYLYLFQKAHRGDTVVFKSPSEEGRYAEDPDYSVNYIKRLIGIGPETIVLLDGDVYIGPFGSRDPAAFHIWRKPEHVQNVLWRSVYDNDFIPHLSDADRSGSPTWKQPWTAQEGQSGWNLGAGGRSRAFTFSGSAAGVIAFDPQANPKLHMLTDYLAYDEIDHRSLPWEPRPISDLKLGCTYTRTSGDGPLQLQLTKSQDCFTAEVAGDKVMLRHSLLRSPGAFPADAGETIAQKTIGGLGSSRPARVELANVDHRVTVRVNGEQVIAYEYEPDVQMLWTRAMEGNTTERFPEPMVRITAASQQCVIEHLQLFRDIYYLNSSSRADLFWASPRKPADLRQGEYFVLGDNSFISGDARYWSRPVVLPHEGMSFVESGRVPESFMLGKAFFVYWPAGYSLPGTDRVNIVPDFGDMRMIH